MQLLVLPFEMIGYMFSRRNGKQFDVQKRAAHSSEPWLHIYCPSEDGSHYHENKNRTRQ